jgi:Family of unknown function (DUF6350)
VTVETQEAAELELVPALRSPVVTGAIAAFWAAVVAISVCVLVLLVVWTLAEHSASGPGDAVHAGVLTWLAANHGTIVLSSGVIDLVPLGLVLVPAVALFRSGCWAGRACAEALPAALGATLAMALVYGVGAGIVASASAQRGSAAEVGSAMLGATLLALVAGGSGVLRGGSLWDDLWAALPEPAEPVLRAAAAGLAVLVGGGALLVAGSLAWHAGRIAELTGSLGVGAAGGVGVLLVCVLAIPTAAVWAAAYAVGPGFAVGVGTTVAPAGIAVGAVPALPVLAALPDTGPAPGVSLVALAIPPLAGVVVGWFAARRPAPGSDDRGTAPGYTPAAGRTAGEAFAAGALSGAGLGLLVALSSGSIGAGRMADVGPDAVRVALAAAVEVGAVAALVAYEGCRHHDRLVRFGQRLGQRFGQRLSRHDPR